MSEDLLNRHPDFTKEFVLTTDASNFAIGAVLNQTHGPLCFASRTLNKHECNYSTIEKELLAIVWQPNNSDTTFTEEDLKYKQTTDL